MTYDFHFLVESIHVYRVIHLQTSLPECHSSPAKNGETPPDELSQLLSAQTDQTIKRSNDQTIKRSNDQTIKRSEDQRGDDAFN
jgi:hypothetical protein